MPFTYVAADGNNGFINAGANLTVTTTAPSADDLVFGAGAAGGIEDNRCDMPDELTFISATAKLWTLGIDGVFDNSYLIAAGTEDGTYLFGHDGTGAGDQMAGAILTLRGHDTTSPFRVTPASRHSDFRNDDGSNIVPASIGGSANSEPDVVAGDLAVLVHYMMENPFNDTGAFAPPTGFTTRIATGPANRQNLYVCTKELEAGDISSGTFTPGALQSTYDAGEGDHNNVTAIYVIRQAPSAQPPAYTETPNVTGTTPTQYTIRAEMTEDCTLYAVAVAKDQTPPTIAQVKAGNGTGDVAALAASNQAFTADTQATMTLGGSLTFPLHDLYMVASNAGGDATLVTRADEFLTPATGKAHVIANPIEITGATQANPVVVTAPAHGLVTGQDIYIYGIDTMTELNSPVPVNNAPQYHNVEVIDTDTFRINAVDSTGFATFASGSGAASKGYPLFAGQAALIANDDVVVHDTQSDLANPVTVNPDGTFEVDTANSTLLNEFDFDIYDVSAEALLGVAQAYINNSLPELIAAFEEFIWEKDIAIPTIDLTTKYQDADAHALTFTLPSKPSWMSINAGIISGTPDTSIVADSFTIRATDALGGFTETEVSFVVVETGTVPNVVNLTEANALLELLNAGFENVEIVLGVDDIIAIGNVISQLPVNGTIYNLESVVTLTVHSQSSILLHRRRR